MRRVAHWTAHDLTHVHQISQVMAHQYRQAVGPFCAYLGVIFSARLANKIALME